MLDYLAYTRDQLHTALDTYLADEYGDPDGDLFSTYTADDPTDCDYRFVHAANALTNLLEANPINNPTPGRWIGERLDMTLVADVDGSIGGYTYRYRLYWPLDEHPGRSPLTLGTDYVEWKHARGQQNGVEGIVDFLFGVLGEVNDSIRGYNASIGSV